MEKLIMKYIAFGVPASTDVNCNTHAEGQRTRRVYFKVMVPWLKALKLCINNLWFCQSELSKGHQIQHWIILKGFLIRQSYVGRISDDLEEWLLRHFRMSRHR